MYAAFVSRNAKKIQTYIFVSSNQFNMSKQFTVCYRETRAHAKSLTLLPNVAVQVINPYVRLKFTASSYSTSFRRNKINFVLINIVSNQVCS